MAMSGESEPERLVTAPDAGSDEAGELLGELWHRIEAGSGGDAGAVLDETALRIADRLLRVTATSSGETPVEVVHAIAIMRVIRFLSGAGDDERSPALSLLTEVWRAVPELVSDDVFAALGARADDGLALLGSELLQRAQLSADRSLLDQAVDVLEEAVRAEPAGDELAGRLSNLGLAYRLRAERYGVGDDLRSALAAGERSVSVCPEGAFEQAGCLANLADSFLARFERDSDPRDLRQALAAYRAAVVAARDGHPLEVVVAGKLGIALKERFVMSGHQEDIDSAVDLCARAAASVAPGDVFYAQCQTNLGSALAVRATWNNLRGDIEAAVTACRNALDATAPGEPAASVRWSNLSAALHDRYELLRARDDLDDAVAAAQSALAGAGPHTPEHRALLFANVSNILRIRGDLDDDRADLEGAVDSARSAVKLSPTGHAERANRLNNLGTALLSRFEAEQRQNPGTGAAVDLLTEGIAALTEATRDDARNSNLVGSLSTLGLLLLKRFQHAGAADDLTAAIEASSAAVAACPAEHPLLAGIALNLGSAWREAFEHRGTDAERAAAIRSWQSGTVAATSPSVFRLACARQWAELAAEQRLWHLAAEGYGHAVALLPVVSWRGLRRLDQENELMRQATVSRDAAAALLATADPATALAHLEQGRAVLWTQRLDLRSGPAALHHTAPELAEGLDRVRAALDGVNAVVTPSLRQH
ncbi:hypothetical protein GCM10009556_081620 [Acrocarpospora pleiomorpha]